MLICASGLLFYHMRSNSASAHMNLEWSSLIDIGAHKDARARKLPEML